MVWLNPMFNEPKGVASLLWHRLWGDYLRIKTILLDEPWSRSPTSSCCKNTAWSTGWMTLSSEQMCQEATQHLTCWPSGEEVPLPDWLVEWMVLVWMFIQFPHLKGSDGKDIEATPTEVTLGFLRSAGVDEKHQGRKPAGQNPQSERTQPRHQERGRSAAVFWPALKFFKFAEQWTASYIRPAKGLHNEVDYILQETRCLTLPAEITPLPPKEVNCSKGKRCIMGSGLTSSRKRVVHLPSGKERCMRVPRAQKPFRSCPSLAPFLPPSLPLPLRRRLEIIH